MIDIILWKINFHFVKKKIMKYLRPCKSKSNFVPGIYWSLPHWLLLEVWLWLENTHTKSFFLNKKRRLNKSEIPEISNEIHISIHKLLYVTKKGVLLCDFGFEQDSLSRRNQKAIQKIGTLMASCNIEFYSRIKILIIKKSHKRCLKPYLRLMLYSQMQKNEKFMISMVMKGIIE